MKILFTICVFCLVLLIIGILLDNRWIPYESVLNSVIYELSKRKAIKGLPKNKIYKKRNHLRGNIIAAIDGYMISENWSTLSNHDFINLLKKNNLVTPTMRTKTKYIKLIADVYEMYRFSRRNKI